MVMNNEISICAAEACNRPLRDIAWSVVTRECLEIGRKLMDVMGDMDRHYRDDGHGHSYEVMASEGCHYFYGTGDRFEVAVGYQWNHAREKYQLRTAGFRGDITPDEALSQMIALSRQFMRNVGISLFYTIVPRRMDNPRIMQMYGLVPWHPEVKATGGHYVEGGTYWRIELLPKEDLSDRSWQ
jgi:hypothetical protein